MMNNILEEYKLNLYTEIREIAKNKIYIVISTLSNSIYIKKILNKEYKEIYSILKENENKFRAKIFDCFIYEDKLIVIEEFINGRNLEEILKVEDVCEEKAIDIIENICDGLIDLHSERINLIHRDIKPENIMINNDGILKIIDFDASRISNEKESKDTIVLGTRGYASPEQFGFAQTDKRSDIYSIGILLNYILIKELPKDKLYEGNLKNVIKKAIEVDREKRYSDFQELKKDLRRWTDVKELKVRDKKLLKAKMLIKKIVGFRSGKLKKSLIAMAWYFISGCMLVGYISYKQIVDLGFAVYLILIPEILIGNFFGLGKHIPFYNSENKKGKVILRIGIGIIITVIILWIPNIVFI